MVISPELILEEIATLKDAGLFRGELLISERAHVILPIHRAADEWEEKMRGGTPTGTTLRGIGPAYEDRVGRWGVRMADLLRPDVLGTRVETLYRARAYIKDRKETPNTDEVIAGLEKAGKALKPYICATEPRLWKALAAGDRIILEGAQGTGLDSDFGTYPYTTSSHTTLSGAFTGSGLPPQTLDTVIGVTKAYATRVGNGPFPTELTDEVGDRIRERGGERGATTGRPRRCGWLDLVSLRYAAHLNGLTGFAVTKVDVLGGEDEVHVATHYTSAQGTRITDFPPALAEDFAAAKPVYATLRGWEEFSPALKQRLKRDGYAALPPATQAFLSFVERETGVPVQLVSYGPAREDTIVRGSRSGSLRHWAPPEGEAESQA
jgi:adenylosuccinate synthase